MLTSEDYNSFILLALKAFAWGWAKESPFQRANSEQYCLKHNQHHLSLHYIGFHGLHSYSLRFSVQYQRISWDIILSQSKWWDNPQALAPHYLTDTNLLPCWSLPDVLSIFYSCLRHPKFYGCSEAALCAHLGSLFIPLWAILLILLAFSFSQWLVWLLFFSFQALWKLRLHRDQLTKTATWW